MNIKLKVLFTMNRVITTIHISVLTGIESPLNDDLVELTSMDIAVDGVHRPSSIRTTEQCAPVRTDELKELPSTRSISSPSPT